LADNGRMPDSTSAQLPKLDYFVVDVFTDAPLQGNAREFNLSETTFIERRSLEVERAEGVRVRIFTTQEELPFAGHPTLGTASVLKANAPETVRDDTVTLAMNVGAVPVRFEQDGGGAALLGEMTQRDPDFGAELSPTEVAPLLGMAVDDLDQGLTPQVVSTGNPFAIVVLRSVEALTRLKLDQEGATAWLRERGARWFYVLAPVLNQNQGAGQWRARMQFHGGEDPATGSAAGCAISYLVDRGAVPSDVRVHVQQGVEIGRPSDLFLTAKKESARVTAVRVAGSTVPVAKGQLFQS